MISEVGARRAHPDYYYSDYAIRKHTQHSSDQTVIKAML